MMVWGREPYFKKAEKRGLEMARRLKLPLAIASDTDFGSSEDVHYVRCSFPDFGEKDKRRKSMMGELTPFDQTLYLDCDVVLLSHRLTYAWRLLEQDGGLVMAIGRSVVGGKRFEKYGLDSGATYHNTGVVFFDTRKTARLFKEWKSVCLESETEYSDEYLLNALLYERNYPVASLPPAWNLRTAKPYPFLKHLRIWHSSDSTPACAKDE